MRAPLSFEQRRDQSVRILFGFSVAQDPEALALDLSGSKSENIAQQAVEVIQQRMRETGVDKKGFTPPYNLLRLAIDNMEGILRPAFEQRDPQEIDQIITDPMLTAIIATTALRKKIAPEVEFIREHQAMNLNAFLDGMEGRGCPYAGDISKDARVDPLFQRFVPWGARLIATLVTVESQFDEVSS